MQKFLIVLGIGVVILLQPVLKPGYAQNEISVDSLPPVVVQTVPQSGDIAVNPTLTEIRVTFSKPMMTEQMWSWVMLSPETFPGITGDIRYLEDGRTCVAPVRLEPGRTYAVWINSQDYRSFRDQNNHPAVPYLLVFRTREAFNEE